MSDDDKYLTDNLSGKEGSLVYFLHEKSTLDLNLLSDFYRVAKSSNEQLYAGTATSLSVARVYSLHALILKYFACHFDPNDGYTIDNLSADTYCDVVDELQSVFDLRKLK